jgi:hypothetical protein
MPPNNRQNTFFSNLFAHFSTLLVAPGHCEIGILGYWDIEILKNKFITKTI